MAINVAEDCHDGREHQHPHEFDNGADLNGHRAQRVGRSQDLRHRVDCHARQHAPLYR